MLCVLYSTYCVKRNISSVHVKFSAAIDKKWRSVAYSIASVVFALFQCGCLLVFVHQVIAIILPVCTVQVIAEEIAALQAAGITPTSSFAIFKEKVLAPLPMNHGGHSIVARGLYVLQLQQWWAQWPADQIAVHSIAEIKGRKEDVQHTLDGVFRYLDLPPHDTLDLEAKNTRKYEPIPQECRALLDAFYAPFNAQLFAALGKELVW